MKNTNVRGIAFGAQAVTQLGGYFTMIKMIDMMPISRAKKNFAKLVALYVTGKLGVEVALKTDKAVRAHEAKTRLRKLDDSLVNELDDLILKFD